MLNKLILTTIMLLSTQIYAQCVEDSNKFNPCGFSAYESIKANRFNQEFNKLKTLAQERSVNPIILNQFNINQVVNKADLIDNFNQIFSIENPGASQELSDKIQSTEIKTVFENAFTYIKSVELNLLTTPLFQGFSQSGLNSWSGYSPGQLNDGYKSHTGLYNYTGDQWYSVNIYRGIVLNFNQNVVLKTIIMYMNTSTAVGTWRIDYFNGSSWVTIKDVPYTSGTPIEFNEDGAISASFYRIYINSWSPAGTNLYLYEVEAFKHLID